MPLMKSKTCLIALSHGRTRCRRHFRGAGARSPFFWKFLLLSVAVIWGYSFTTMKDAPDTILAFAPIYVRFLPASLVMFAIFHKRIIAHFKLATLSSGLVWAHLCLARTVCETIGLAQTTAGKSAF